MFGLGGHDVLGHGQVDELVLGLGLHQAGALLSHHHDVLGDVDVTVQACRRDAKSGRSPDTERLIAAPWTYLEGRWSPGSCRSPRSCPCGRFQHCNETVKSLSWSAEASHGQDSDTP